MILDIMQAYSLLFIWLAIELRRSFKLYRIKWNGHRWVVRNSRGQFVRITRNPWDLLAIG